MECVVAVEFLRAQNGEMVAKEVAIVSKSCMQTHHFKSPYPNYYHSGSDEIGISWDDGFIPYSELFTVLDESTKNFAHVYSYGTDTCNFLQNLLQVPVHDLQKLMCPEPHKLHSDYTCYLTCHKNYSDLRCAMKHAHALYTWLEYHLQTKRYIRCPKDKSRHTAAFSSGLQNM